MDEKWHEAICKRANYICEACNISYFYPIYFDENEKNKYVCGHHVKGKKAYPMLRHCLNNGRCVCHSCHNKIHNGIIKNVYSKHSNNYADN